MHPIVVTPPITDPAELAHLRHAVADQLRLPCDELVNLVLLVVSELVTNALLHAGGSRTVRVLDGEDRIRVEVEDAAPHRPPRCRSPRPDAVGGRGLQIVDGLSERWGVDHGPAGKVVWCELSPSRLASELTST